MSFANAYRHDQENRARLEQEKIMTRKQIKQRLEQIRADLRAERISYGDLYELQCLAKHITPGDVELAEAAGIPEEEFRKLKATGETR
jgi:sensor domain CHASE-containing protein